MIKSVAKKLGMKKFEVDIVLYGTMTVYARDEEAASRKVHKIPIRRLKNRINNKGHWEQFDAQKIDLN